jgi:hypothetical protein
LHFKFHHAKQEAPKKSGFAMFGSDDPSIEEDSPPIVDDDPGYYLCNDELFNDNTKNKKFTDIIQFIIDLCDFPCDSLMVVYITNKA